MIRTPLHYMFSEMFDGRTEAEVNLVIDREVRAPGNIMYAEVDAGMATADRAVYDLLHELLESR